MPSLRLLGRGGYEHVELPFMAHLNAPIWSTGFEYTLNEASQITAEGGEALQSHQLAIQCADPAGSAAELGGKL